MSIHSSSFDCRGSRAIRVAPAALVLLLGLSVSARAEAGNLLSNGEFPNNTNPWRSSTGFSILWSNLDHANGTSTGSARFAQPASFVGSVISSEGVSIVAGQQVSGGAYFRTAAAAPSGAVTRIHLRYYTGGTAYNSSTNRVECSGTKISVDSSSYKALTGSWALTTMTKTSPSGSKCAQILIETVDQSSPEAYDLVSDGVYIDTGAAQTPSAIFTNGFESGNFNGWTVTD